LDDIGAQCSVVQNQLIEQRELVRSSVARRGGNHYFQHFAPTLD
jgi:hypothetical protein